MLSCRKADLLDAESDHRQCEHELKVGLGTSAFGPLPNGSIRVQPDGVPHLWPSPHGMFPAGFPRTVSRGSPRFAAYLGGCNPGHD